LPRIDSPEQLAALRERIQSERARDSRVLTLCGGTGCQASGSLPVLEALQTALADAGVQDTVRVRVTGCQGFCEQGPILAVDPEGLLYCRVTPEDVPEIVRETVCASRVVERLLYTDPVTGQTVRSEADIPFYKAQNRVLLSQNRRVDPRSIDDYVGLGGYAALARALGAMRPEQVIDEVRRAGLRGRGGGGFPAARKWEACRNAPGEEKYVICNADEGDPGAYMDRSLLEGNPHLVLEGMILGAFAVGASKGYIYVRNEYPLAVDHAREAVARARELGLLGPRILGASFSFDIDVVRGAGAFVCGESTALMASLEGKVGEPRAKDVHTVLAGLYNKPTVLNNVETWANVPRIVRDGAREFARLGTAGSKGTKILALTGRVRNTGLIEVAMGVSLRTIVEEIGGGAPDGGTVKAVQTGGPSGGCIPRRLFDLPVDYEALADAGSMVGSGGMVVMDQKTCMVDVAKYFLSFLKDESCGKCAPCRLGVDRMLEIVTDITEGRGTPEQLDLLEDLADTVAQTSLCGLGKTAPNPVLSTLRYFRDEYEAHIHEKRCPAGVCSELVVYQIIEDLCKGCGLCLKACPHDAVAGEPKKPHAIDPDLCRRCGICLSECPAEAITIH
jgi:NADH-quinone oxidoreductase subunit F